MPNNKVEMPRSGAAQAPVQPPAKRARRDWSGAMVGLGLGLAGLVLARAGWLRLQFDVFSALTIQAAFLVIASALGLLSPRYKTLAASSIFVLGLLAYGLWPSLPVAADEPIPPNTKRLRLATFNIDRGVGHEAEIIASLKKLDADVVVLTEFDPGVATLNTALHELFPSVMTCESSASCDVTIASRLPLTKQSEFLVDVGSNATAARLGPEFGNLLIVGVHTTRFPRSTKQFAQLSALSARLTKEPGLMIVAGDFNATPQSRLAQQFAKSLDLEIATYLPTYPTAFGLPQLAIDQIMVRTGIAPLGPQMGADAAGSDHIASARTFAVPVAR